MIATGSTARLDDIMYFLKIPATNLWAPYFLCIFHEDHLENVVRVSCKINKRKLRTGQWNEIEPHAAK